jgi:hypothetical protein
MEIESGRPTLTGFEDRKGVRPGWSVAVIVAGVAAGVAGLVVEHNAAPAHSLCQLAGQLQSFDQSLSNSVGSLPAFRPPVITTCGSANLRYDGGLIAALVGLALAIGGLAWLMRRSRRSARQGAPWPVRRRMDAAANWLDVRLPRARTGSQPRLRGGFLSVLAVLVVVVAVGGLIWQWDSYQRSQQIQTYETANAVLAAIKLPPDMKHAPGPCQFTVCATSRQSPAQIGPFLRRLLHGAPAPAVNALLCPIPIQGNCPVTIYGHFHGAVAFGDALQNLIVIRNGKPPKGAVPIHPNLHSRPGQPVGYWYGSQVTIDAIDPRQTD